MLNRHRKRPFKHGCTSYVRHEKVFKRELMPNILPLEPSDPLLSRCVLGKHRFRISNVSAEACVSKHLNPRMKQQSFPPQTGQCATTEAIRTLANDDVGAKSSKIERSKSQTTTGAVYFLFVFRSPHPWGRTRRQLCSNSVNIYISDALLRIFCHCASPLVQLLACDPCLGTP